MKKIIHIIGTRKAIIGLMALNSLLLAPTLFFVGLLKVRYHTFDNLLLWQAIMSMLWLALLHVTTRRSRLAHCVLAPIYIWAMIDLFIIVQFGSRLSATYLIVSFTDYNEVGALISSYWRVLFPVVCIFSISYWVGLNAIKDLKIEASRFFKLAIASVLLLGYIGPFVIQARKYPLFVALRDVAAHDFSVIGGSVFQPGVAIEHIAKSRFYAKSREKSNVNAVRSSTFDSDEVFIVVLGESARPDRWSLYGYSRDTTPNLRQEKNIITFHNWVASASLTSFSVPSMLSLYPITDWDAISQNKSIVSAFRESGFTTYWISTQEISSWGGIVHLLASEAEHQVYLERSLDDELVHQVQKILAASTPTKKLAIFLHGRGNHFGSTPYPPQFNVFPKQVADYRESVGNIYDNGTLFMDSVLSGIIKTLKIRGGRAALFYASDHGENLGEIAGVYGHGIGNRYDLRVPAFFWYSDALKLGMPEQIDLATIHSEEPLGHGNFAHSIIDLAQINCPRCDQKKSLFNASFKSNEQLYLNCGEVRHYQESSL